jgi:hypothetical protein
MDATGHCTVPSPSIVILCEKEENPQKIKTKKSSKQFFFDGGKK